MFGQREIIDDTFCQMREIAHMPDQEAVDILRNFLKTVKFPRGNGKTTQSLKLIRAISKGIEALERRNQS